MPQIPIPRQQQMEVLLFLPIYMVTMRFLLPIILRHSPRHLWVTEFPYSLTWMEMTITEQVIILKVMLRVAVWLSCWIFSDRTPIREEDTPRQFLG